MSANTAPDTTRKRVSYVFPIYNESGNIDVLFERMCAVTDPLTERYSFEFIFINDGSTDDSLQRLFSLREHDPRVQVYSFARNYGHQIAVTAGIDVADGDAVIIMDSDLQDPPEVSIELIERWQEGADVVYAERRTRKDSLFKRASAHLFYWLLSRLASIDIPRNTGDFRLIDRRVVLELRKYREHSRFVRGLVAYVGFRQESVLFDRDERYSGETGYPLRKMLRLAGDGILGFSTVPIQIISRVGIALSVFALLWTVYLIVSRVIDPTAAVQGWTFIVAGMFLLGGIQMMMLGVLGNYIGRIYQEVQHRPLYAFDTEARSPRV